MSILYLGYWQNSVPQGCQTEGPLSLLAVSRGLFPASPDYPHSLVLIPALISIEQRWFESRSCLELEKTMAPHSSTLAWKIPWMEEPGRLQSMGLLRVEHGWVTSLSLFTFMHWRRKWQPTPVFLPGESQGQGSLVGCCLWGRTALDMTEWLSSSSSILRIFLLHFQPYLSDSL